MSSNSTLKPKVQLNINEFSNLIALLSFLKIQKKSNGAIFSIGK